MTVRTHPRGYFYLTDRDLARLLAEQGDATVFQS